MKIKAKTSPAAEISGSEAAGAAVAERA